MPNVPSDAIISTESNETYDAEQHRWLRRVQALLIKDRLNIRPRTRSRTDDPGLGTARRTATATQVSQLSQVSQRSRE